MRTIDLTCREYMTNFRKIAKFSYLTEVFHGTIYVTANINDLKLLGF